MVRLTYLLASRIRHLQKSQRGIERVRVRIHNQVRNWRIDEGDLEPKLLNSSYPALCWNSRCRIGPSMFPVRTRPERSDPQGKRPAPPCPTGLHPPRDCWVAEQHLESRRHRGLLLRSCVMVQTLRRLRPGAQGLGKELSASSQGHVFLYGFSQAIPAGHW